MLRVSPVNYKGYRLNSLCAARWAVFFDACGVDWEYQPEAYLLENGRLFVPDFLLRKVDGRVAGDLFVAVRPQMKEAEARDLIRFAYPELLLPPHERPSPPYVRMPLLVVGKIPEGETIDDIDRYISDTAYESRGLDLCEFNFETIDGDHFAAHPGVNQEGRFELFGDDGSYLAGRDDGATLKAWHKARRLQYGPDGIAGKGRVKHA